MNYDAFVGQVQHRAHLGSKGEAVSAIRATLQTLAERLTLEETKDFAAQLPREIGIYMAIPSTLHAQRFSLDDFFELVTGREGAVFHARVVLEVAGEAVSAGEMRDVSAQLPDEFRALIASGSHGALKH